MAARTSTMRNLRAASLSCCRIPPGRMESTVRLSPISRMKPKRNALTRSGAYVFRHLPEVVNVALHVVGRMLHRNRPVFLGAGSHQHAAVALVQPAQVGERFVDLQVVAVIAYALGAIGDAATCRQRDHVKWQLVLRDHLIEPALKSLGQRVEMRISGGVEDLEKRHLRCRHRQGVAIERAHLSHTLLLDHRHHVGGAANRAAWQSPPIALARATRSGVTPNRSVAPPAAIVMPVLTSSNMTSAPLRWAMSRRPAR